MKKYENIITIISMGFTILSMLVGSPAQQSNNFGDITITGGGTVIININN